MQINRPFIEHRVIEIFDIDKNLESVGKIDELLYDFVKKCNLTIVSEKHHNFTPYGFTKVYILSESHIIFHSWPENNYLNIDLMSCKELISSENMKRIGKEVFQSDNILLKNIVY